MNKKKTPIYLIGAIMIAVIGMLIILTFIIAAGSMHIRKTGLVIETKSKSKEYDGKPLVCEEYVFKSGRLSKGHTLEVKVTGSQTTVGISQNTADVIIRDAGGFDVTDQYQIKVKTGQLEVLRKKLTFKSESATKIYDGQPFQYMDASLIKGRTKYGGSFVFEDFAAVTEPGVYPNTFSVTVMNSDDEDVTDQYEIEYEFGELSVYCSELTIRSDSAVKEYDGTPLTKEGWSLQSGRLYQGHTLKVENTGSITQTGSCKNTISARVIDQSGHDVSNLYEINTVPGDLMITPRRLVIRTKDVVRKEDDVPKMDDWELIEGQLALEETISVRTSQQIGNHQFGESDNLVSLVTITHAGESWSNRTSCYQIEYLYGKVTIVE